MATGHDLDADGITVLGKKVAMVNQIYRDLERSMGLLTMSYCI